VALNALKNDENTAELGAKYEVHPTMVGSWKRELIHGVAELSYKGPRLHIHGVVDAHSQFQPDFPEHSEVRLKSADHRTEPGCFFHF